MQLTAACANSSKCTTLTKLNHQRVTNLFNGLLCDWSHFSTEKNPSELISALVTNMLDRQYQVEH